MRLLLVEDDQRMRALVKRGLTEQGHHIDEADSGPAGLTAAQHQVFDVIVLDVMLPGFDGVDLVRRLRSGGSDTPVLMLTARDAAADIVAGLDAGADDYLVKPFPFKVLLARLRALGRRATSPATGPLQVADVILDQARHLVTRGGAVITLTATEFRLLECLLRRTGRVVTRAMLLDWVWGDTRQVSGNTLDAFVKSLRHKLDADGRPRLIHTIRSVGYSLREEPEP